MKARAVIGANYGDEGKGLVTDYLCAQGAGMVVRFNGGAQAGHTVEADGQRHVFRHFGSGSLQGVPTFLSQFFIVNPILYFKELDELRKLGLDPVVYAHPQAKVSTFADMIINQRKEDKRAGGRHGSCGVGIHETMVRDKVIGLTMADLWNRAPSIEGKIAEICDRYARFRTGAAINETQMAERFIKGCWAFADHVQPLGMGQCKDPVFEGAQGLLLDMDNKANFPHVTHSKTGLHNVRILCQQAGITDIEAYYVTRTYLTKHGAGPLLGEDPALSFEDQTNVDHPYQGTLRFARLDEQVLERVKADADAVPLRLVVTHCDQLQDRIMGDAHYLSHGPNRDHIEVTRSWQFHRAGSVAKGVSLPPPG